MSISMQSEIKDILKNEDVAFVIGNGINRRFFSDVKSWMELLESLWEKYGTNASNDWNSFYNNDEKKLEGITLTELFDLIEMKCHCRTKSVRLFPGSNNQIGLKEFSPAEKKIVKEIAARCITKSQVELTCEFATVAQDLKKKCREWCKENIIDANLLTDVDCVIYMTELLSDNTKLQLYRNILKKEITKEYLKDKDDDTFNVFMKTMESREAPVLTTNFDTYMSSSLGLTMFKMGNGFTDFYPWNVYFGKYVLDSPIDGFGIWHINGLVKYPRSIKLGLSDYMGCVERARNMIHHKNMNEFFDGKNRDNWVGYNTWLHIVFNKPLFIFGLALDENEVFLRWLLIQRAKYSKLYGQNLKGWYVDNYISKGKRVFLESLGFKIINTNYDELYDAFL